MPLYPYECPTCGYACEEFQHMKEDPLKQCPECGGVEFHRVPCLPHTDMVEFHKPIEMLSIALNTPDEIRDFQRACPDVEISDDPADENYGVPIARSRKQKLQALRAAGFEEK